MKPIKYIAPLILGLGLLFMAACQSPKQAAYTTLYTVEHSTTAAYDSFLSGVVSGNFKTNDVPKVSKTYDQFQIAMRGAVELTQFNYESIAPSNVVHLGTVVIKAITEAKAR